MKRPQAPPIPAAPDGLSAAAKRLWQSVHDAYAMEEHHAALLEQACLQLTRADQARAVLAKEGVIVRDRFGQQREHPAAHVERAASLAFLRLCRELGLDVEALPEVRAPRRAGTK